MLVRLGLARCSGGKKGLRSRVAIAGPEKIGIVDGGSPPKPRAYSVWTWSPCYGVRAQFMDPGSEGVDAIKVSEALGYVR
jgi:hypothetical protein